jgi:hypothetical protein
MAASENKVESARKQAHEDAMALAELIYDIFKNEESGDKIEDGQNNAQSVSGN